MLDLAKKEHFREMVKGVVDRAESLYGTRSEDERNLDAVGRVGLAIGLDGNPMYTGVSNKQPIVSLVFSAKAVSAPVSMDGEAEPDGAESKLGEADESKRSGVAGGSSAGSSVEAGSGATAEASASTGGATRTILSPATRMNTT